MLVILANLTINYSRKNVQIILFLSNSCPVSIEIGESSFYHLINNKTKAVLQPKGPCAFLSKVLFIVQHYFVCLLIIHVLLFIIPYRRKNVVDQIIRKKKSLVSLCLV